MKILIKHHYISCESCLWLNAFACFNQQVSLLLNDGSFYLAMNHNFITLLYLMLNARQIITHLMINVLSWSPMYGEGKKEKRYKWKIKARPWYFTCSILQWIVFMWAVSGKCEKQNWWLYNDFRGKRACFELTTALTAWTLKLEISCQKYCL